MSRARSAVLALVAVAAACTSSDRDAVQAVRAYDDALVVAFRTGDASGLAAVAGADEVGRIGVLLAMKAERRVVLESELESFEPRSVERPGSGEVRVVVRERWRYVDRPLDPGLAAAPPTVSTMTMRYVLAREDGRLKVREVRTVASDRPAAPAGAAGAR